MYQVLLNSMIKDLQGIENTQLVLNEIDVDSNGVLSMEEYAAECQKIDAGTSEEHLQKLFEAHVEKSGNLSFEPPVELIPRIISCPSRLR
jgi:Ca2+-binding EF-hand superfamily protein